MKDIVDSFLPNDQVSTKTGQGQERVLGWQDQDNAEVKLAKLEEALRDFSLALNEVIPLFAALLSLPLPEDRYPPLNLTPQQQKQQTLDAIVAWLMEEAERRPVLQVWEDLHWADPSTLELLALEIDQAPTAPILNVLTFRPEFQPPWPQRSHMTPLTLNRLERPEVAALIKLQADGKTLPEEVVEHIVAKTDGVPLYVEELTKTILEADFLREQNGSWELAGQLSEVAIPATLQDSLMARLDRLPSIREVAQLGAVLGREFAYEMVQAIVSIEETTLQEGLAQLVDADLLYQRGRPPRAKYIFKHALVQDAAYQSLLKRTRQYYHRQVAELIEARFPETVQAQPELVAHHYTEAGLPEPAIGYWRRAGAHAIERSANLEAINQVGRALELLETLPETVDRDRQELDLQLALGAALIAPKGYAAEEVRLAFQRANELCQKVGEVDQRFQAVKGLWNCHFLRAELSAARDLARELSILSQESGGQDRLLMVQRVLALTHLGFGEYGKSLEACERGIELHDPDRQSMYLGLYGEDPGLFCYAYSIWANHWLGHLDAASVRAEQALELAKRLPSRYALSYVLVLTASFFLWQRRLDTALECAYAAQEVAEEQSIPQWRAWADVVIGGSLTAKGQMQEGLGRILKGREAIRTIRGPMIQTFLAPTLAVAYCDCGEYAKCLELLEEAESTLTETITGQGVSEIYRLRGNILAASGEPPDGTEAAYKKALDLARTQEAKTLELRAAVDLARFWQTRDRKHEAYDLLKPIYSWFTEGFDTPDLKDAKALLDELA